ncbi:S-type anion channel SLAH3 [Hibiscus syriacus]|uniref:S-type anion channel SLAH3 n=1 Tax=Hibiscus syriacus TaxID=106335 RepID=A0A6A3BUQ9_HIBSY|nr:S-type anion channel SLAH2-like [Hibiscus syriacus]KAE8719717.1 S-type anion channel SLAH3 [Hibiscus syriacus]
MDHKPEPEAVPSLLQLISSNQVAGFDNIPVENKFPGPINVCQATGGHERAVSVSISMPSSPTAAGGRGEAKVFEIGVPDSCKASESIGEYKEAKTVKFLSQPMPKGSILGEAATIKDTNQHPSNKKLKDKRYDSFKTWSGRLERQLSNLRGRPCEIESEDDSSPNFGNTEPLPLPLPVDRYFDALEGPELESLKASEEIVLPHDKTWPFLLRYPISSFGICLGVSSQAIMWKTLAIASSTKFLHINLAINLVLWCISVALVAIVASIYLLKVIIYFEAVRREYFHPIRVNFFFAPWIALLFLALGVPPSVTSKLPAALWYILMTPIFCLELKIYGQWMSGGQRRLSKVANPSNHLSIVGNFVGALLGASMGLKEGPIFFFAVGLAHYTVLFVTLYQRLPTNETLPKELHPVFFLFVAAPSVASMAWASIQGSFDYGSRIAYFIALFLYFSLAVRVNFFRGFKFSLSWWAYTFPMTGAAIATIRYSSAVTNIVTQTLSVMLSIAATLTVTALLVTTILHAFVLRDLFPNDIAIAISDRKPKPIKKWFNRRHGSLDNNKDIETFLKFVSVDSKDIEAALKVPTAEATSE